jgi:hypothetical protein
MGGRDQVPVSVSDIFLDSVEPDHQNLVSVKALIIRKSGQPLDRRGVSFKGIGKSSSIPQSSNSRRLQRSEERIVVAFFQPGCVAQMAGKGVSSDFGAGRNRADG